MVAGAALFAAARACSSNPQRGVERVARWLTALAGCGCGPLPGALSLPSAGIALYAFGPALAAARLAAGGLVAWSRCRHEIDGLPPDPLDQLAALVPFALAGGFAAEVLRLEAGHAAGWPAVQFLAGAVAGLASPCALGTLAFAASVRQTAPGLAWGLAATAGLVPLVARHAVVRRTAIDARVAYGMLALSALGLVRAGGAGLVHPRLIAPLVLCALASLVASAVRPGRRCAPLAPALICAALVCGSPAPRAGLVGGPSADAFAGQAVRFTGVVRQTPAFDELVRFEMTCCRADAHPVALRLDRRSGLRDGTWAAVAGTFRASAGGLVVQVSRIAAAAAPRDPFLYR